MRSSRKKARATRLVVLNFGQPCQTEAPFSKRSVKLNDVFAQTSPSTLSMFISPLLRRNQITTEAVAEQQTEKMKWFRVLLLLSMCSLIGAASAAESQSNGDHDGGGLTSIISKSLFEKLLKDRGNGNCNGSFYTYEAFIEASKSFSAFGTTGDLDTRKRDVAAFLGQTSFESAGGYPKAFLPAYCLVEQFDRRGNYCVNPHYPCNSSTDYYGRGAILMTYNQDYWEVGKYFGVDLINYPELAATDPVLAFKTAFWYWMIPRWPRPSCHDVITGKWKPSEADKKAGRLPGYGVTTNILNGGLACGRGPNQEVKDRTGFYVKYCKALRVSPGNNLDCYNQEQYPGLGLCGVQGYGAVCCRRGHCCSLWGFCGVSDEECITQCQSQCRGGGGGGGGGSNVLVSTVDSECPSV